MAVTGAAYDDFVAASPQGSVFSTSWWLEAVAPGAWRPHTVEQTGRIVGAWPTVVRTSRAGPVHVGAPLTPFLGPLFLEREGSRARSRELETIERLLERIGPYAHLEARCNPAFDYWTPLSWRHFGQTTSYTWRLTQSVDEEATFARFGEKTRGHVRAAEKKGLEVEEGELRDFLALHERRIESKGREGVAPATIERIDAAAASRRARTILLARDAGGRVRAGGFFVHDNRFVTYLLAATDGEVRGSAALVVWSGVKLAAARGVGFDFEGSMLRHVESFVRGFGGAPTPYSIVRHTPSRAYALEVAGKRLLKRLR